jgi:adenylate cyclase
MKFRIYLYIWLVVNIVVSSLYFFGALDTVNYAILNYFFYIRSQPVFSKDIVIIGITDRCIEKIGRWPWRRDYYVRVLEILKESRVKVVGMDILFLEPEGAIDGKLADISRELGNVIYSAYFNTDDSRFYLPIPVISKNSLGIGHINVTPATNGFIYSLPLSLPYKDGAIEAFSLKISEAYLNKLCDDIPVYDGNLLINYTLRRSDIIPFTDVIEGKISREFFSGKIVLIGITARGLGDYFLAPSFREPISGVEIHANAVNTIVTRNFLKKISKIATVVVTFILSLPFLLLWKNPIKLSISGVLIAIFFPCASFFLFSLRGIIFDSFPLILSTVTGLGISGIYAYLEEKREKDRIRDIFRMYLPSEVIDRHLKDPGLWNLKGEEVEVTVMFVDISGFTKFSQEHRPRDVVEFLNRYFSIVTDIVFRHRGTLDKFIGDGVMVIYGAPVRYSDHPREALLSAFDIIEAVRRYNIHIKVGINTGNVILGNIGTEKRIQYTAIGDAVNMAEYLESIAGPDEIIIGEATYNRVKDIVSAEKIVLKGKYDGRVAFRVIKYG